MIDNKRLDEADVLIQDIAKGFGLDFYPTHFDIIPPLKMMEIMAYRFPVNFSHWSFGRDFEQERTKYDHGYGLPYEVVMNSNPCRAFLMENNPFPIQVLVIAHVYAHCDFMKMNHHFKLTRTDMITSAAEAAGRFKEYEDNYSIDLVERLIDAGMSIEFNIDPTELIRSESEDEARERLFGWSKELPKGGDFDDLLREKSVTLTNKREGQKKTPPEPTADLLKYIINNTPRRTKNWEKDILGTIRDQALYFTPYRRTKIMNEGWATYWHERIMAKLFEIGFLTEEEHGYYNLYNARVKANARHMLNPYLLGFSIFKDIKTRWDKGQFGDEYEECRDNSCKLNWDKELGLGDEKIMSVRRTLMDWFFVDEFLSEKVCKDLELFVYMEENTPNTIDSKIVETNWKDVKQYLVLSLSNSGLPVIKIEDGNYHNSSILKLKHYYSGRILDLDYVKKTLEHIHYLWERPVYLTSKDALGKPIMFTHDGDMFNVLVNVVED